MGIGQRKPLSRTGRNERDAPGDDTAARLPLSPLVLADPVSLFHAWDGRLEPDPAANVSGVA
jgi:hypothetical protein